MLINNIKVVLKFLVYGSLKNVLKVKPLQLQVIQTYGHYRNELKYFDQRFHHHVILKREEDQQ